MSQTVWATLAIEPTDDAAAIRRAYARKLKQIDVESDPAAFMALRDALEGGLAYAAFRRQRSAPQDVEMPPCEPGAGEGLEQLPADDTPDQEAGEDPDARFIALANLLFAPAGESEEEGYLIPDAEALIGAVEVVIRHPDMENVDHSARVEVWLARILYEAIPRSDAVIPLVVDWFGWEKHSGKWDQPWLLEELVRRRHAFRLIDEVADPGHPHHKAWRDLTSDKESLGLTSISRGNEVSRLLETIRRDCPAAEGALNPLRVALWDERLSRSVEGRLKWAGAAFALLFVVGQALSALSSQAPSAPPPAQFARAAAYSDPQFDLAPLVREFSQGNVELDDLATTNPRLHERLMERWREAKSATGLDWMFGGDVRRLLEAAAREGLRGGDARLQADFWRLYAERLQQVRQTDPDACATMISGSRVPGDVSAGFERRMAEIKARAIEIEAVPTPASETVRFLIPAPVFRDTVERSGMPEARVNAALNGGGTAAEQCKAGIALIEATLAATPERRDRLLREMSMAL
ncbi:MAG: hypothetical protein M3177_03045 [Pseudomonadota bacterium]|nr:hypothetical protein [Pseudomonadota bacterium]